MAFKYFVLICKNNIMNPTFSPVRTRLDIWKFTSYFVTRKHKNTLNFVTKKTFNEPPLTIYTKIMNTNGKFIVQFVRFRSQVAEFCTFLLEAIFIYFIFFVPQFGL